MAQKYFGSPVRKMRTDEAQQIFGLDAEGKPSYGVPLSNYMNAQVCQIHDPFRDDIAQKKAEMKPVLVCARKKMKRHRGAKIVTLCRHSHRHQPHTKQKGITKKLSIITICASASASTSVGASVWRGDEGYHCQIFIFLGHLVT